MKERLTREEKKKLNDAKQEYVDAMRGLGVSLEDIAGLLAKFFNKRPTKEQQEHFIEAAEAASQAAKQLRGNTKK